MSTNTNDFFPPDHQISLTAAATMTALFRQNRDAILQPAYQDMDILPICETFNRNIFDALLSISSCAGIRIYYGMTPDLKMHAVLVAADIDGHDIVAGDDPLVGDVGVPCPPFCPPASPLNQL